MVGAILIAIGYEVDSVTGNYIGDLSKMPTMLTWMIVIIGAIPAFCAIMGVIILRWYPIDHPTRLKIQEFIKNHDIHHEQE